MKPQYGTMIVAIVFVVTFSIYSFLISDEPAPKTEAPQIEKAEIVVPLSELIEDNVVDVVKPEAVDNNESLPELTEETIPDLKSFNQSELEEETSDIQTGLDFLENPF